RDLDRHSPRQISRRAHSIPCQPSRRRRWGRECSIFWADVVRPDPCVKVVMNTSGFARLVSSPWPQIHSAMKTSLMSVERRGPLVLRGTSALFFVLEMVGVIAALYAFNILAGTAGPEGVAACKWCSQNAFDEWVRTWLVADDRIAAAELSHQFSAGVMG